jgi:hypothetical protein
LKKIPLFVRITAYLLLFLTPAGTFPFQHQGLLPESLPPG